MGGAWCVWSWSAWSHSGLAMRVPDDQGGQLGTNKVALFCAFRCPLLVEWSTAGCGIDERDRRPAARRAVPRHHRAEPGRPERECTIGAVYQEDKDNLAG